MLVLRTAIDSDLYTIAFTFYTSVPKRYIVLNTDMVKEELQSRAPGPTSDLMVVMNLHPDTLVSATVTMPQYISPFVLTLGMYYILVKISKLPLEFVRRKCFCGTLYRTLMA